LVKWNRNGPNLCIFRKMMAMAGEFPHRTGRKRAGQPGAIGTRARRVIGTA
jgi:hypothetical protein